MREDFNFAPILILMSLHYNSRSPIDKTKTFTRGFWANMAAGELDDKPDGSVVAKNSQLNLVTLFVNLN